jgi:hypothetical protein
MAVKRCPKCGLVNPGSTVTCDCGWSFAEGTMGEPRRIPGREDDHGDDDDDYRAPIEHRSAGPAQIGIGVLLLFIGLIITGATYSSASSSGGGTYLVAYGPIIVGIVTIIRGIINMGR